MTSQNAGLTFAERKIGEWVVPTIEFSRPSRPYLRVAVNGVISTLSYIRAQRKSIGNGK